MGHDSPATSGADTSHADADAYADADAFLDEELHSHWQLWSLFQPVQKQVSSAARNSRVSHVSRISRISDSRTFPVSSPSHLLHSLHEHSAKVPSSTAYMEPRTNNHVRDEPTALPALPTAAVPALPALWQAINPKQPWIPGATGKF